MYNGYLTLLRFLIIFIFLPVGPSHSKCLTDLEEVRPQRFAHLDGELPVVLGTSDRVGHRLVTQVFYFFLKEILGYANVQIRKHHVEFNTTDDLNRLAGSENNGRGHSSSIPMDMVNLEVWLPLGLDMKHQIISSHIELCGLLGPAGRFGWFVPESLTSEDVDRWESFRDPLVVELFDYQDEDWREVSLLAWNNNTEKYYCDKSYCENGIFIPDWCKSHRHKPTPCAVLLATNPEVSGFVVNEIINLKLFVKVVWIGDSFHHYLYSIMAKYENSLERTQKSLLFFNYIPNEISVNNTFRAINFPRCKSYYPYDSNCKHEIQQLEKIVWKGLKQAARPAYEAVHRMALTQGEYENMMRIYINNPSIEDAACQWLQQNPGSWEHWNPVSDSEKTGIFIGGIFPMTGSFTASGIVVAAQMATDAINANKTLLRDYNLQLLVKDGHCRADYVMKSFIDYILLPDYNTLAGILGPACSDTVEPLAGVSKHYKSIVISYSAEGSTFSDRQKYPYFFRTIGENKQFQHVYLSLFQQLGWTQVASLTEDGQKYVEYISHLQDLLQTHHISFVANRKFPRERAGFNMSQYLADLKIKRGRIIIGDFFDNAARAVMCAAYHEKMTAKQGYVWFLPAWFSPEWYNVDFYNKEPRNEGIPCNTSQMIEAINGHLALTYAYYAPRGVIMQENITVTQWREHYTLKCKETSLRSSRPIEESDYGGFAYDAVWTYALALDKLLTLNQSLVANLHSENATQQLVKLINETDFHGVSGHIKFFGGPSRLSTLYVLQWLNNKTRVVGTFKPDISDAQEIIGGHLDLNMTAITWLTPDHQKPSDGKESPARCVIESFATFLGVQCDVAIAVANILGFGALVIILIICFFVVKRRYDKKMLEQEQFLQLYKIDPSRIAELDSWEIPRDKIVLNRKLGEGAFGTVYGGEAFMDEDKGWVAIAVKTLKVGSNTEEKIDFLSEAETMKRFDHKNIIKLLGVCTKGEPVYNIMEFMLYGDLKTYLLGRRHLVNEKLSEESDEISAKRLTSMALDVARGLSYLGEIKYVHRDVACRNCLVNAHRVCKLGDFGMTRSMCDSDYYKFHRKGMLPVRWMSPESLGLGLFTPASDVWSYGVLLYEIVTFGSFPFQGLSNNQVLDHVKAGNTIQIPRGIKPQLEALLHSCWNMQSEKRPQGADLVEFLANNPRIISPCLDIPLSSVPIEGKDQLEFQLPEKVHKCTLSVSSLSDSIDTNTRRQFEPFIEPATSSLTRNEMNPLTVMENGGVKEPLLSHYVTLRHRENADDDIYCSHDPPIISQAVNML